ncbi:MAG: hypothetical protein EHM70_02125 [Chloroflexota bacterium]|nr:MAG: hypothetical protein EHM70_02125 [Chloroflexota bacterium]
MKNRRVSLLVLLPVVLGFGITALLLHALHEPGNAKVLLPGPNHVTAEIKFPIGLGGQATDIEIQPLTGLIYVAAQGTDEISVISGTTIITNMRMTSTPYSLHANPVNGLVYAGLSEGNKMAIISGTTIISYMQIIQDPCCVDFDIQPDDFYTDLSTGNTYFISRADMSNSVFVISGTQIFRAYPESNYAIRVLAGNPANGYVYTTGYGYSAGSSMNVIRGTEVISNIRLEANSDYLGINPSNGLVYASLGQARKITVIRDTQVISNIQLNLEPFSIFAGSLDGYVYIAGRFSDTNNTFATAVISGTDVLSYLPGYYNTYSAVYHPSDRLVYIARSEPPYDQPSTLFTLRGTEIISQVLLSSLSGEMAYHPLSGAIYAILYGDNTLAVIHGFQQIATVPSSIIPTNLVHQPYNGYIYAIDRGGGQAVVISGTQAIATLPAGHRPESIAANPKNGLVYIVDTSYPGSINVIRETQMISTINEISYPAKIAVDPETGSVYCLGYDSVTIIQETQVITQLTQVSHPQGISIDRRHGLAFIYGSGNKLFILRGEHVVAEQILKSSPHDITYDPSTGLTYILGGGNGISVFDGLTLLSHVQPNIGEKTHLGKISANGGFAYASLLSTSRENPQLLVLFHDRAIYTRTLEHTPQALTADPGSGRVYLTFHDNTEIQVWEHGYHVNTLDLDLFMFPYNPFESRFPVRMSFIPETGRMYVGNPYGNSIYVLDPLPEFGLAPANQPWMVRLGSAATYTLDLATQGLIDGPVDLQISGLPEGVTALISPNPAHSTGSASVVLQASSTAAFGPHQLTFTSVFSGLTRTTQVDLFVFTSQDYLPVIHNEYAAHPTATPTRPPATPTPTRRSPTQTGTLFPTPTGTP